MVTCFCVWVVLEVYKRPLYMDACPGWLPYSFFFFLPWQDGLSAGCMSGGVGLWLEYRP